MNEVATALNDVGIPSIVVAHGAAHFCGAALPMPEFVDGMAAPVAIGPVALIGVVIAVRIGVVALGVAIISMMIMAARHIVGAMVPDIPVTMGVGVAIAAGPAQYETESGPRRECIAMAVMVVAVMPAPVRLSVCLSVALPVVATVLPVFLPVVALRMMTMGMMAPGTVMRQSC